MVMVKLYFIHIALYLAFVWEVVSVCCLRLKDKEVIVGCFGPADTDYRVAAFKLQYVQCLVLYSILLICNHEMFRWSMYCCIACLGCTDCSGMCACLPALCC